MSPLDWIPGTLKVWAVPVIQSIEWQPNRGVQEYWDWLTVSLFLLVTVDLLTTFYAMARVGIQAESNPLMQWLLAQPIGVITGVHLGVIVSVAVTFNTLLSILTRAPHPYNRYLAIGIEAWLGGLLAAGLLVFANNLSVIVYGSSLL